MIDSLSPLETSETSIYQPEIEEISQDIDQSHDLHEVHHDSPRTLSGLDLASSTTPPTSIHDIQFSPGSGSALRFQDKEILELGHARPSDYRALALSITSVNHDTVSPSSSNELGAAANEALQESCLLRYFIEELSPWVRNYLHIASRRK